MAGKKNATYKPVATPIPKPHTKSGILAHFDFTMLAFIAAFTALGLFLVAELNTELFSKHLVNILAGFVFAIAAFFIPYRSAHGLIVLIYLGSLFLLLATEIIGSAKLGAKRWIEIPLTSFSIQPSEFVKISLMLMLASHIYRNPPPKVGIGGAGGYGWAEFGRLSAIILLPTILIALQPDLGTALLMLLSSFGALFLIGINKKIWITLGIIAAIGIPTAYNSPLLKDYQKRRIADFISPKAPYQVTQSLVAIGSGGLFGKSKEQSTQSQLNFLPYATTDFMFAYYIERFGLVGGAVLVALYFFFTLHILAVAFWPSSDYFLRLVASYIAVLLFLYASVNILMVMGLAPVVGIPLPLLSYGGTSFLTFMVMFGIFQNLVAFRQNFEYNLPFRSPFARRV